MIISTHAYKAKKVNGKLDKHDAMFQCVRDFKRHNVETLDELNGLVNRNVVYSPVHFEGNHRNKDNAVLTIDMLVFDIDDGQTMDEVLESKLGLNWEIMLLKTASWTPQLEKFRVFVPLATPLTFNNTDEYREFYKFIDSYYDLQCDKPVMEAGRGYIGVKNKEAVISSGEKWLDLTKTLEKIMKKIRRELLREKMIQEKKDAELKRHRQLHNIKVPTASQIQSENKFKELSMKTGEGSNYSAVYRILSYCKFRGQTSSEAADSVLYLNLSGEYGDKKDLEKKYKGLK